MTHVPSPGKMVDLLKLIHKFEFSGSNKTSPKTIPTSSFREAEASGLKGIDHTIIGVGRTIYFKT